MIQKDKQNTRKLSLIRDHVPTNINTPHKCTHSDMYTHIHIHTRMHAHTNTHTHTHTHTHKAKPTAAMRNTAIVTQ